MLLAKCIDGIGEEQAGENVYTVMTPGQEQWSNNDNETGEDEPPVAPVFYHEKNKEDIAGVSWRIYPELVFGETLENWIGTVEHGRVPERCKDDEDAPDYIEHPYHKHEEWQPAIFLFMNHVSNQYHYREEAEKVVNERDIIKRKVIQDKVGKHREGFSFTHVIMKVHFRSEIKPHPCSNRQYTDIEIPA